MIRDELPEVAWKMVIARVPFLQKWKEKEYSDEFQPPSENDFIPRDFTLHPITTEVSQKVKDLTELEQPELDFVSPLNRSHHVRDLFKIPTCRKFGSNRTPHSRLRNFTYTYNSTGNGEGVAGAEESECESILADGALSIKSLFAVRLRV